MATPAPPFHTVFRVLPAGGYRAYWVAVAACCSVLLLRFALEGILGGFVPFVPFAAAVAIAAWYGGLTPGLLATGLSAACAQYFFVPERYALSVDLPQALIGVAVFISVGILVSVLCESLHRMRRRLAREQESLRVSMAAEARMYHQLALSESHERSHAARMQVLLKSLEDRDRRRSDSLITIVHELRNPLAPVRNLVHVLRAKAVASPELHWVAELLNGQVALMRRLIDDLQELTSVGRVDLELQLRRVELAPLLRSAVDAARALLEAKEHQLTVSIPPEPVYLEADAVRLSQVLSNLLSNAVKYTDRGGHILIATERDGGEVEIRIRDNGIGIPLNMLEPIFEPFMRLDAARHRAPGGLGVGLALARRLVCLHGGTLTARSDGSGAGSEFRVRLPCHTP